MSAVLVEFPDTVLRRSIEDLHAPAMALHTAAAGLAAGLHAGTVDGDGLYFLLEAVASQLDTAISRVETTLMKETHR